MKFKITILFLLILSSSLFSLEIKWEKDFQTAMEEAKKQDKIVFFVFSSKSCHFCRVFDEGTLQDDKVVSLLNKDYVSVTSYSQDDYIPRKLISRSTPTIWFLNAKGEVLFQPIQGAVDAQTFLQYLNVVNNYKMQLPGK